MGYAECMKKTKVIMVPYPAQGHVTPMLQLASALHSYGFKPIVVTPQHIHKNIVKGIEPKSDIICMSMPDGLVDQKLPPDFFDIDACMENHLPIHLERIVHELDHDDEDGGGVTCMVVDLLASWAIEVANKSGVNVVGFWPVMFAAYQLIAAIPEMVKEGLISEEGVPQHQGTFRFMPSQPMLHTEDLPWLIGTPAARKGRFKFWIRTLHRCRSLKWLLANSSPEECDKDKNQSIKNSFDYPRVLRIGPLNMHAAQNLSFWDEDLSCLNWLDMQGPKSVVYISFGSWVSPIGEERVRNLAFALEASKRPFLWVLKPSWRNGLPTGYEHRVSKQGKMVSWAPQLQVLKHKAIGCYLTHCGWNSTIEAIQCQKPLLCYPIAGDQALNCAYIVDVWKIGTRLHGFGENEVEEGLRTVMEDSEMDGKLWNLYESTMGNEANLRVKSHLALFVDEIKMSEVKPLQVYI